jgi:hypothetical protein
MRTSHKHQTTLVVWIFSPGPNLVLKTVGVMHLAHRAFEVFDYSDPDLARFDE